MEKITLQPGIWTTVIANACFQSKSNQSGVRIHYTYDTATPAVDTDVYFVTQAFDLKLIRVPDYVGATYLYMMPDADQAVDVVVL